MYNDVNYIYKEMIKNLLSLFSSKKKIEILQGKLFINDEIVSDKNQSLSIVTEIAYVLNIRILNGVSKETKYCKLGKSKRGHAIELLWIDIVTGDLFPQYFNDTAIRKVVNKRDIGSSKNGLLYRTFVKLTREQPKPSRIPITKMLCLYTNAETKKFGHKGDEKIVNSTLKNVYIQFKDIESALPKEYQTGAPFDTLPMYANRTKQTQSEHHHCMKELHSDTSLDYILQGVEQNQNAYKPTALKDIRCNGKSNKVNGPRYTYDTEAEIELD